MKSEPPLVTVVIPAWNNSGTISDCLRSLLSSTYRNIDVIVVDNGSTDRTSEVVREGFPNVKVIRNSSNLGFSGALNSARGESKGDYILWLSSDANVSPRWIEVMVENLQKDSGLGMASSLVVYRGPGNIVWSAGGIIDGLTGLTWDHGKGENAVTSIFRHDIDYVPGCAAMVSRDALARTGGLDDDYFMYFEDAELGLRLKRAGFRIAVLQSLQVQHHALGGSEAGRNPSNKLFLFAKSNIRFVLKNWPFPRVIVAFASCFCFYLGFALVKGPRHYTRAVIQAAAWNLSQFSRTRALGRVKRAQPLPSTKTVEFASFIMRMMRHPELFPY
jgi:GT2 family glycosyltransferase